MNEIMTQKEMILPKHVHLQTPTDFTKFEDVLRSLCEKFLSHDWDWTFRVSGQVQREIERTDPENPGLHIIREGKNKQVREKSEKKREENFQTPWRERGTNDEKKGPRLPPPPPPTAQISRGVAEAMGKRGWEIEKLNKEEDERFFNIHRHEFESNELLRVRKEIWDWAVECVQGKEKKLFCAHLLRETDKWDLHQLYRNIRDFLQTENYREYGQRLEKYFTAQPKDTEDIFTYMSRLDKYTEEIEHLQHMAEEAGETLAMPKFYRAWKILSAVEKFPEYRLFTDRIQQMPPQEWIRLNPETIRTELHKIHSNKTTLHTTERKETSVKGDVALVARRPPPPPSPLFEAREGRGSTPHTTTQRSDTPIKYPVSAQLKHFNCPEGVCLGHFRFGRCPRIEKGKPCNF
jgi:hypothetical protein